MTEFDRAIGGDLHVSVAGTGETGMLLLHPNPLDGSSWLYQTAHFSNWFRTLSVDLPGYGHSPRLRGPITMERLAAAVWQAADARSVDRAIVAGVSIGAALALHMVRQQPHRAAAVIISGYGYGPDKPFARRRIEGYTEGGLEYRLEHMRAGFSATFRASKHGRYFEAMAQDRARLVDVPSIIRLFEAHGEPDPDELFATPCPTLLIMGSDDYAFERSAALHERMPGSELVVIEGAGHACHIERPWRWDAAALEFLRRRTPVLDETWRPRA